MDRVNEVCFTEILRTSSLSDLKLMHTNKGTFEWCFYGRCLNLYI